MTSKTHSFVKFKKSPKKGKKYTAVLKNKKTGRTKNVHFGSTSYQQYKDRTGIGAYSHKNHNDPKRRKNFKARMGKHAKKKYSAAYFATKFLW